LTPFKRVAANQLPSNRYPEELSRHPADASYGILGPSPAEQRDSQAGALRPIRDDAPAPAAADRTVTWPLPSTAAQF
jgi:hypothetical protein